MSDPLRLISNGQGARGPGALGPSGPLTGLGAGGAGSSPVGGEFARALMGKIDEVSQLQSEAAKATEDWTTGDAKVEDVILATQKADVAFKMLLALRNKVQAAYDEVKQVRI